ncbi:MAG: ABC transporter permease [Bacteroidales bacterium]|nr:ABC transporter permease [Bacteroidales bacterium]
MRLEGLIAARYLFGRKQKSVVTVISWISLIGLMVSTAALIIVLSVYNGIGELTKGLFGTFDPELVIEPAEGKTFHTSQLNTEHLSLTAIDGVEAVSQMVNETAWMTYGGNQAIVRLRGVDSNYRHVSPDFFLNAEISDAPDNPELHYLLVGGEIYYTLAMHPHTTLPAAVHIPKRGTVAMGFTMEQAFNTGYAYPIGYFFIQQDLDRQYVVTDIDFVRQLMDYSPDEVSALAVKLKPGANVRRVKKAIHGQLSTANCQLTVKDRHEQQPLYYKIFRSERLGIYLILSLIVLISTLSLVASLSLLVINKSRDIFVLQSMGLTRPRIRRTFRTEGMLICAVAVAAGLLAGFVVCLLQQQFGIIRMGDGNFVVSAFPVAMRAIDFLLTFLLVMAISTVSVTLTIHRAKI